MLSRSVCLLALVMCGVGATGCDDPADTVAQSFPSGPQSVSSAPPAPSGDGQPPPDGGAPAGPGGPSGEQPVPDGQVKVEPGEGVLISGTISYTGNTAGALLMDAMRDGTPYATVVHSFILGGFGPFQIEAPKDLGDVYLVAYVDIKGDGPTAEDPGGHSRKELSVESDAISGVKILVKDDPELGHFKPWLVQNNPSVADVADEEEPFELGSDKDAPPPGEAGSGDGAEGPPPGEPGPEGGPPPPQGPEGEQPEGAASAGTQAGVPDQPTDTAEKKAGGLYKPNGEPWNLPPAGSK